MSKFRPYEFVELDPPIFTSDSSRIHIKDNKIYKVLNKSYLIKAKHTAHTMNELTLSFSLSHPFINEYVYWT